MAVGGLRHIADDPGILAAISPTYGIAFLATHGTPGLLALGAVFLAVTGAEALYADMGHFGRTPIQTAWLGFVLPCLALNYIGQGALLLADPAKLENPFFLLYPDWALLPMVGMATIATIIASQAVITGAFSLTQQAIQLGLLPRMEIRWTSETREGPDLSAEGELPAARRWCCCWSPCSRVPAPSPMPTASPSPERWSSPPCMAFFVVWRFWRWPLWAVGGDHRSIPRSSTPSSWPPMLSRSRRAAGCRWSSAPLLVTAHADLAARHAHPARQDPQDGRAARRAHRMLEKSQPHRVKGTAVFLTSDPTSRRRRSCTISSTTRSCTRRTSS